MSRWLLVLTTGLVGCEGKTSSSAGEYEIEGTSVAAGINVPDASAQAECGVLNPPGVVGKSKYRVTSKGDGVTVFDESGGCRMDGRIEQGVVIADGSVCSLSDDALLRQFGVLSSTYQVFRLDPTLHTLLAQWSVLQKTTTGLLWSCNVLEGHVTGYSPESGDVAAPGAAKPVLLRYDTSYNRTPEQADMAAACADPTFLGQASGFLTFDANQLALRFEALDCTLKLEKDPQGAFKLPSNQRCEGDNEVGFMDLGINLLSFDSLSLDLTAKTLQAAGRAVRNSHDGERTSCLQLDGKIEQVSIL